jgi:hypothetical protein
LNLAIIPVEEEECPTKEKKKRKTFFDYEDARRWRRGRTFCLCVAHKKKQNTKKKKKR